MLESLNQKNNPVPFLIFLIPVLAIILSGCVYNGVRARKSVMKITPERISTPKLNDKVNLSVVANAWHGAPKNLKNHITPFYIDIDNRTKNNILISENDFVLFDEYRNQYNPLTPKRVANILISTNRKRFYIYPRISFGIGTSFYHDRFYYYGHHYYPFYRPYYYFNDYPYYNYRRPYNEPDLEDVFSSAINPGTIRPNANLSGYIYFNKVPEYAKELTLEIGYANVKDKTTHKLAFHFDITKNR